MAEELPVDAVYGLIFLGYLAASLVGMAYLNRAEDQPTARPYRQTRGAYDSADTRRRGP